MIDDMDFEPQYEIVHMSKVNWKRVAVRLDDLTYRKLRIVSAVYGKPMQATVEDIIHRYLESQEEVWSDAIRQAENLSNPSIKDALSKGGKISNRQTDPKT